MKYDDAETVRLPISDPGDLGGAIFGIDVERDDELNKNSRGKPRTSSDCNTRTLRR